MADLKILLVTPLLQPLDPGRAPQILSAFPFVDAAGVANLRDIGGIPVAATTGGGSRLVVRKGRMYRAATLNNITPVGKETLRTLNIEAVFDLRTLKEVRKYANISPNEVDPRAGLVNLDKVEFTKENSIKVYHIPLSDSKSVGPKLEFAMLLKYARGDEGYLEGYTELLELGGNSFGIILRYMIEETKDGGAGTACLWALPQ